jgi:hypothetical protein
LLPPGCSRVRHPHRRAACTGDIPWC